LLIFAFLLEGANAACASSVLKHQIAPAPLDRTSSRNINQAISQIALHQRSPRRLLMESASLFPVSRSSAKHYLNQTPPVEVAPGSLPINKGLPLPEEDKKIALEG